MERTAIVQTGAAVLRQRAVELTRAQLATPEIQALIETMIAVMRAAPGVGLAAPQIGIPLRLIVLEDSIEPNDAENREKERAPFATRTIVNPVLRTIGRERVTFFEGCLSVEGFAALVERDREVEVTGLDEHGAPITWRVAGWPARILQHEVDHLDGTLYIDRMFTRTFATFEHVRDRFAGRSISEIRAELGV